MLPGSMSDVDRLVADLAKVGDLTRAELEDPAPDPLHSLSTARELAALTDDALHALVAAARSRGVSWQGIGEALGTSRQAAYQRFGGDAAGVGAHRIALPDAATRALEHLAAIIDGRWAEAAAGFGPEITKVFGPECLASTWAQVIEFAGPVEGREEPVVRPLADVTFVELVLHHANADVTVWISYDTQGRIIGLWFRPVADEAGTIAKV